MFYDFDWYDFLVLIGEPDFWGTQEKEVIFFVFLKVH